MKLHVIVRDALSMSFSDLWRSPGELVPALLALVACATGFVLAIGVQQSVESVKSEFIRDNPLLGMVRFTAPPNLPWSTRDLEAKVGPLQVRGPYYSSYQHFDFTHAGCRDVAQLGVTGIARDDPQWTTQPFSELVEGPPRPGELVLTKHGRALIHEQCNAPLAAALAARASGQRDLGFDRVIELPEVADGRRAPSGGVRQADAYVLLDDFILLREHRRSGLSGAQGHGAAIRLGDLGTAVTPAMREDNLVQLESADVYPDIPGEAHGGEKLRAASMMIARTLCGSQEESYRCEVALAAEWAQYGAMSTSVGVLGQALSTGALVASLLLSFVTLLWLNVARLPELCVMRICGIRGHNLGLVRVIQGGVWLGFFPALAGWGLAMTILPGVLKRFELSAADVAQATSECFWPSLQLATLTGMSAALVPSVVVATWCVFLNPIKGIEGA